MCSRRPGIAQRGPDPSTPAVNMTEGLVAQASLKEVLPFCFLRTPGPSGLLQGWKNEHRKRQFSFLRHLWDMKESRNGHSPKKQDFLPVTPSPRISWGQFRERTVRIAGLCQPPGPRVPTRACVC